MDNRPFTVDEVRFFDVTFRDPAMVYPIFRAESKTILGPLLDRDERNMPFRTEPLEAQELAEGPSAEEVQAIQEPAFLDSPQEAAASNYRSTQKSADFLFLC